jgi:putative protein kinase ArgK-like GTPase of G3E family
MNMAFLVIDDKEYHAKTDFKFERRANEKYKEGDVGGFMTIYLGLLQFSNDAILQFWDCALSHYKKDKPAFDKIEEALEKQIEEDGDTEKVLKEAFEVLDTAGFFRKQVKSTWKEFTNIPKAKKDETEDEKKEREEHKEAAEAMKDRYKDLMGQTLTKS